MRAGELIERCLLSQGLGAAGAATVDGIVAGSPDTLVTGIAVTFLASQAALERSAALGANFVIAHEGLYYSHRADGSIAAGGTVALAKNAWIEASGMVVYRYHDGIHRSLPDRITEGLIEALEWQPYVEEVRPEATVVRLPSMRLGDLASALKEKLALPYVRVAGDLNAACSRAGVAVGYRGGAAVAVPLFEERQVDVVIAGEGPEWETPEYVRDAVRQGKRKALILLGHAASEEPGMERLARRLQAADLGVPVHFVSERPALEIV
ncbi:Nif3-like dinuclear metal center hexameric protein [Paenibacillus sp.]|uniref:Nif3-like dinuclear metal center hexameric protein n=1 Tax=Paenibacillus sp. TaxID=58172 RepID=UPI002D5F7275|nr:Nif3-like dinuclear metal center hexameric protein [Paenibacillus sp.]HZG86306.1 Nif3-like dinuclear metal center hexameric protein [Paenibacillus sp.]